MAVSREYHSYIDDMANLPVAFKYGKTRVTGLAGFREISRETETDGKKESTETVLLHPDGSLQVTVASAYYPGYNAFEWTLRFKNKGKRITPVLSEIKAAALPFEGSNPVLKGIKGDGDGWYEPYAFDIGRAPLCFLSMKGRSTDGEFPYFNLENDSGGTMIAIGWPGTWSASFSYDNKGATRFTGTGTYGFCSYLKPGETVRTPLMAFLRYFERNEDKATQLWRQWYIDCNMPPETEDSAQPMQPKTCFHLSTDSPNPSSDGSVGFEHSSWRASFDKVLTEDLRFDYQWYDAGWYFDENGESIWDKWYRTGTLTLDKNKWPDGTFLEMSEYLTANGVKTLLWFEPERIGVEDFEAFCKNYGYQPCWKIGDNLSNLGDPACLDWTCDKIITVFEETGVDLYREDFNTDPAPAWVKADLLQGPFRTGITENKYVQGHLELWDRIIRYCADTGRSTIIDSCASGGRRDDLETMRRAVPFLRSDADRYTPETRLSVTSTYMKWIPCNGTNMLALFNTDTATSTYLSRVSFLPINAYAGAWTRDSNLNYDALRKALAEWRRIKEYYYEDFYALTPWRSHTDDTNWTAWMFFDPGGGEGVLQVFRQGGSSESAYTVRLRGVDDDTAYSLTDAEGLNSFVSVKGSELKNGVTITLPEPASAALIYIAKA